MRIIIRTYCRHNERNVNIYVSPTCVKYDLVGIADKFALRNMQYRRYMTADSREFFVPALRYLQKYRNEDVPGIILFAYVSRNIVNQYIIYGN